MLDADSGRNCSTKLLASIARRKNKAEVPSVGTSAEMLVIVTVVSYAVALSRSTR